MGKIIALTITDIRNIFREQLLYFMFAGAPVLQFAAARFLVPWIGELYPQIEPYYPLILLLLLLQLVTGTGFVIASILLDERDEGVLTALRIMPISENAFILYRLLFAVVISFLFSLFMILFSGLAEMSLLHALINALLLSLISPIMVLILATFSQNKIEGLAIFKGVNLVIFLPVAAFFINSSGRHLFGILPFHWSYQYFNAVANGQSAPLMMFIAVVSHLLLLNILVQVFKKKVL